MNNLLSISSVRANLPEIVAKVGDTLSRVTITVNGQPKAVLMSAEELESLEETAEVLVIPHIKEDIKKSKEQIKRGKFVALSDLE
ncbi:prevent-host-death protein [Candidatus Roizmanbacteria bacterium CG_4_10_14_0_8_um_filter_39_9]|uniref:Antitoxin n=1 Tax=Candidatus Roizmanbacteria bacterium CG_4_10_14_0_8_um_filter_39_9 TaxID=1974829 RepID=A0A2M7QFE6_9BACT|nr:MAG: prevent-host-death protein [Candidatus Roizmanbacteria bacterium CG_4_10_14_0_8_um_filter_39_9]